MWFQALLIRWLVLVYELVDRKEDLQALYGFIFYFLENETMVSTQTDISSSFLSLLLLKIIIITCSVLPKVFLAPVLRTSGSWDLPVLMEGSLVRNFNNCYVLLIHVFDGCSNRFDPCDHSNLVCCCLNPVLLSHIYIYMVMLKDIAKSQTRMIGCWNARTAFLKNQSVLQRCLSSFRAIGRLEEA